jgi:hypothetical protein
MPELNATVAAIIKNATEATYISATPTPIPTPPLPTTALDWAPIPVAPFNIPLWFIVIILSVAALVMVYFKWSDQSANLDSIKVWYIKAKELSLGKMQVIRLSRAGNFIPDCLDVFDNILSYGDSEDNINQWRLRSSQGIIRIGGIGAPILSEDLDQNRDPITEEALCVASEALDDNIDDFRKALTDRYNKLVNDGIYDGENPADHIKSIHSYNDYIGKENDGSAPIKEESGRALFQWMWPEGIEIHSYFAFNQNKSRKFWPGGNNTSAFLGGENLRIVEEKLVKPKDEKKGFLERYGALLICAIVFLACVVFGACIPL